MHLTPISFCCCYSYPCLYFSFKVHTLFTICHPPPSQRSPWGLLGQGRPHDIMALAIHKRLALQPGPKASREGTTDRTIPERASPRSEDEGKVSAKVSRLNLGLFFLYPNTTPLCSIRTFYKYSHPFTSRGACFRTPISPKLLHARVPYLKWHSIFIKPVHGSRSLMTCNSVNTVKSC